MCPIKEKVHKKQLCISVWFSLFFLFIPASGTANLAESNFEIADYVTTLDELIDRQASDPNLLDTKLTIDSLIDPEMDVEATRAEIVAMVDDLETMLRPSMTE